MASGSERRQRTAHLMVRLTPAERAAIAAAAAGAGLSLAGYARAILLAAPPLRQSRRPPVERIELVRLLGAIGMLGSNVNQIARVLNANGSVDAPAFAEASADIAIMRAAIMKALGRAPGDAPQADLAPARPRL
jgi:hypothetical protein